MSRKFVLALVLLIAGLGLLYWWGSLPKEEKICFKMGGFITYKANQIHCKVDDKLINLE